MQPKIWSGSIHHSRMKPKPHNFKYKHAALLIDISNAKQDVADIPGVAFNKKSFVAWHEADYGCDNFSLIGFIGSIINGSDISAETSKVYYADTEDKYSSKISLDRVMQLSQPRGLGYAFNPLTCYFCYCEKKMVALVLEVTNTPWRQRCFYVIKTNATKGSKLFSKRMHVSPFMPMELKYHCHWGISDNDINICLNLIDGEEKVFCAGLNLSPLLSSDRRILSMIKNNLIFCLHGALNMYRIHLQAIKLFLKNIKIYDHPDKLKNN